jgi:hypothetical protein
MLLNMSTRTYELRTRTRAGVAAQPSRALDESPSLIDMDHSSSEAAHNQGGLAPDAAATIATRTYSDVVAARPPSPQRERPEVPSVSP